MKIPMIIYRILNPGQLLSLLLLLMIILLILRCNPVGKNLKLICSFRRIQLFSFRSPGVGWQTFHHTADNDLNLTGLRFKSGCAYYRWYWISC